METYVVTQLDRQLASILEHVESLQHLDPAEDLEKALEESRCLLGAITGYRHCLRQGAASETQPFRRAA